MSKPPAYAVAIDSDGCVFDNMTLKHRHCFGPALIDLWQLGGVRAAAQKQWEHINLFSATRGINRFLALLLFWQTFPQDELPAGFQRPDTTAMEKLASNGQSLSAGSIEATLADKPDAFLSQALQWSHSVNERVAQEDATPPPFAAATAFIKEIAAQASVYVVSSANRATIIGEWQHAGLDASVSHYVTQETCSKAECLRQLTEAGATTLMIGDSPGDWHAARDNKIPFYPITPGRENACWEALGRLLHSGGPAAVFRPHAEAINSYIKELGLEAIA